MPPLVLIAVIALCRSFLPPATFTTRAVESGWGEPVRGLSVLVATDRDTIPLGGEIRAELFLRFSHFHSNGRIRYLDPRRHQERIALHLVCTRTGETYTREASADYLAVFSPQEVDELPYGQFAARTVRFHLLSDHGDQVPAGEYSARVTFAFAIRRGATRQSPAPMEAYPASEVWGGMAQTAVFSVQVVPRDEEVTVVRLPTRIRFREDKGQAQWTWSEESFETLTLVSRPGYHLGHRVVFQGAVEVTEGEDRPLPALNEPYSWLEGRHPSGWVSTVGGPKVRENQWHRVFPREPAPDGASRRFRADVDILIFETSMPGQHSWSPEAGDYRVLASRRVTGMWP